VSDMYLQAETTVTTREDAEHLASEMVKCRLAACAQIVGPIRSMYWWEDEVQNDEEYLVLFKTRAALASKFKEQLSRIHSHDVPEVLLFTIEDGTKSYLDWLSAETQPADLTE
jgi:periplasmic divalent cation tolerance protein